MRVGSCLVFVCACLCLGAASARAAVAPPEKKVCAWEPVFGAWTLQRHPHKPLSAAPSPIADQFDNAQRAIGTNVSLSVHQARHVFTKDGEWWNFSGIARTDTGVTGAIEGGISGPAVSQDATFEGKFSYEASVAWDTGYSDNQYRFVTSETAADLEKRNPPYLNVDGHYSFATQNIPDLSSDIHGYENSFALSIPFKCNLITPPGNPVLAKVPDRSTWLDKTDSVKPDKILGSIRDNRSFTGVGAPPRFSSVVEGVYDTSFGHLTLTKTGGTYDYKNGRVTVTSLNGPFMDGVWEQDQSSHVCSDGRARGRFRFTFTDRGFTGSYGFCDDQPGAGEWNGTRQ